MLWFHNILLLHLFILFVVNNNEADAVAAHTADLCIYTVNPSNIGLHIVLSFW